MNSIKPFSRRSFLLILFWMVLLIGAFSAAGYYERNRMTKEMAHLAQSDMQAPEILSHMSQLSQTHALYCLAFSAGLILLWSFPLWLVVRRTARRVFANTGSAAKQPKKKAKGSSTKKDDRLIMQNQRMFLHWLILLQREGRLMDFFQEDLEMYEDDQIGAAVRDIHNNCRKVIRKNLSMEPIVSGSEGEVFTVEDGFDPDAIKLTGQVTGQPPFKGIIRHKGWRARKLDLPDLSAEKDPTIISPAEIEIE